MMVMTIKKKQFGVEIKVRNLDPVVVDKIDSLARRKGISREEYIRRYLASLSTMEDVVEVEDKYRRLIDVLVERLDFSDTIIESNTELLKEIQKRIEEI